MSGRDVFADFVRRVEAHAGKQMRHGDTVAGLLATAEERDMDQVFRDIVFHATFVVKTKDVLKRIGAGAEGFDTLSAGFSEGIEKVTTLLRTLVKEADEGLKGSMTAGFLSMDQEGLARFLELMADLAMIKHWEVDGHALPFSRTPPARKQTQSGAGPMPQHLPNLIRAVRLAFVLLITLCIVDGPFTILGWVTALITAGLLIVVHYEASALAKDASA